MDNSFYDWHYYDDFNSEDIAHPSSGIHIIFIPNQPLSTGGEIRTPINGFGDRYSTIELHPCVWTGRDSNPQAPKRPDLQSGEPANCSTDPAVEPHGIEPCPLDFQSSVRTSYTKAPCAVGELRYLDPMINSHVLCL